MTKNDLNPKFMNEIFVEKKHSYELRGNDILSVPIPYKNTYERETIRYTSTNFGMLASKNERPSNFNRV